MLSKCLTRFLLGISLCLVLSASAFAQLGIPVGGTTTGGSGSKGGISSTAVIGIAAAAAAGVALAHGVFRHRGSLIGCIDASRDGVKLMNEKDKNTYALVATGDDLKPGDRVELKGKKTRDRSGNRIFVVQKLSNRFGACRQ